MLKRLVIVFVILGVLGGAALGGLLYLRKECKFPFCRGYAQHVRETEEKWRKVNLEEAAKISVGEYNKNYENMLALKIKAGSDFEDTLPIFSGYNTLKVDRYLLPTAKRYGGIAPFQDTFMFVSGDGVLSVFDGKRLKSIGPHEIKNHRKEFLGKYGGFGMEAGYTVKALTVIEGEQETFALASSFDYFVDQDCHEMAIFKNTLKVTGGEVAAPDAWEKIFSAKPCLKFKAADAAKEVPGVVFNTVSAGGRIQKIDSNHVLFSVGDLQNNGKSSHGLAQDKSTHYGKVMLVNLDDGSAEIFTMGHRNPQGLYVSKSGKVFESEHGPFGGDELNILEKGKNYGWPLRTFGVDYNIKLHKWPFDDGIKTHEGYAKPVLSWVPSIGISNILQVESDHFDYWKGDILISTLRMKMIYRVYLEGGTQAMAIERIEIGERIRDMIELKDGRLVLLTEPSPNRYMIISKDNTIHWSNRRKLDDIIERIDRRKN